MRTARILSLVLFLTVPSMAFAQTSRSSSAVADKSWQAFWRQFSAAVAKKNRVALKGMMKDPFLCGTGVCTPSEGIQDIDKLKKWQRIQKSVTSGTKSEGRTRRSTSDGYLSFEFENGRWLWVQFLEDYG